MDKPISCLAKGGKPQNIPCKIRCTKEIPVWIKYRPIVGKVYDAVYSPGYKSEEKTRSGKVRCSGKGDFCIVNILDKKIVLRRGEYEFVGA